MYQQHRIFDTLTSKVGVALVEGLMSAETFANRTAMGRRACEAFGFRDVRGRLQESSS